ncbi:sulfotransferase 1C4-like [Ylistrum balloti]|uniref:sulfotransferase 1C4-like n=1 Tax=Ylistrum balloti TaxID=509963 RepID=UPI002905C298|nr:sulfotransferase 1C4-like [Ylistrum balloti]
MQRVEETDSRGNIFRFKPFNGLKFHPDIPGNIEERLREVDSLALRPDDVLLCTYPKSGTHWVYNMIHMIRSETLQYRGTPYMIEFFPSSELQHIDSPRTLHTHLTYPLIPAMARQGKVKIVQVVRNPKDTITSFYEHYQQVGSTVYEGAFDGFLELALSDEFALFGGNWFSYIRDWEKAKRCNRNLTVFSLQYEEIKQNPFDIISRLVDFFQLDRSESFLRKVEKAVQFENLKKEHETEAGENAIWKDAGNGGRLPIYRKGYVGDWKNYFTVAQNERFDSLYNKKIKKHGVDIHFSYE